MLQRDPTNPYDRWQYGNSPAGTNYLAGKKYGKFSNPFNAIDPELDYVWGSQGATNTPMNYFDYYFSGSDISIYMEGSGPDPLPIQSLSYSIQQQKTPVYGFWSYTHDAVMRGTRTVAGQMAITLSYPNQMKDWIAQAANARSVANSDLQELRGLDVDQTKIEQYWGRNIDPSQVSQNVWSIHPPFNIILVYGMQTVSVDALPLPEHQAILDQWKNDTATYTDINERLVNIDSKTGSSRTVIENVELTGMQTEIGVDGQAIVEIYSFFARDIVNSDEYSTGE